ncbi:hypothetical protein J6590_076871 [Homalodisca vitripennis]|nr:hypothetical protein J6590_076871 [Homalodisca vitripennis]
MTSSTRSPFSNPFKIRRRGSIILSAGGVLDTRCCPHSTPIHEQFSRLYSSILFLCISSQYSYFIYPLGVNHSPCCPPLSIYKTYTRLLVILDSPLPWPRTSTTPFYETPPSFRGLTALNTTPHLKQKDRIFVPYPWAYI